MAKLVRRSSFFKRQKKWEHFKLKCRKAILNSSLLTNLCLSAYIYDNNILIKLTNNVEILYNQVALIIGSLI
jgi:hypothetical protein